MLPDEGSIYLSSASFAKDIMKLQLFIEKITQVFGC